MADRPVRILLVDDDLDIRACAGEILASAGYDVDVAANGQEALHALDRARFDVVVLDLTMPVMSGWQFLEAAAARRDRACFRVVVLTAERPESPLPVDAILHKPASVEALIAAVRACVAALVSTAPTGS